MPVNTTSALIKALRAIEKDNGGKAVDFLIETPNNNTLTSASLRLVKETRYTPEAQEPEIRCIFWIT